MVQGEELPEWHAYLDRCSTVTAFKSKKHLRNIRTMDRGVKIHCNVGNLKTNQQGDYRTMKVWYIPEGIANIFSMHELEKKYPITYNSWEGYYKLHTQNGAVRLYEDKNRLPYIDLKDSEEDAVALLVQTGSEEVAIAFVQTVCPNY